MSRPVLRNKLCDILGIEYPILSAGMGPSLVGEKTGAPADLVVADLAGAVLDDDLRQLGESSAPALVASAMGDEADGASTAAAWSNGSSQRDDMPFVVMKVKDS